jgi:hypothetical protein
MQCEQLRASLNKQRTLLSPKAVYVGSVVLFEHLGFHPSIVILSITYMLIPSSGSALNIHAAGHSEILIPIHHRTRRQAQ